MKPLLGALLTIAWLLGAWTLVLFMSRAARRPQLCVICRKAPAVPGCDECQRCWLEKQR